MPSDHRNEQGQREEIVFAAALQLPAAQRAEYLDKACADDSELRQEVEDLLGAFERNKGFLDEPAVPAAASTPIRSISGAERPGQKIGRYKLLQFIGEGGCGVVYMAEQGEPVQRRVALKIVKPGMDTKSVIARFEAERQALAMMEHPNIARFFDAGVTETGRPYFVMELVQGTRITDYCDQNELDTTTRLDMFMQVCRAVQHAHQKGIIHRDLKPSNILITSHDGLPVPKVIDFGIAKAIQGRLTDQTVFTAFEQFIGTPAYMSPEQAELSGLDIDTRTDIYSLGVLLYELLTGKTPFDAKELLAAGLDKMRQTIREVEPVKPSTRLTRERLATGSGGSAKFEIQKPKSEIDEDLDCIILKCLEKDRTRRYETANGLAMDVQRYLSSEPVVARPPGAAYRFQKLVRRNKLTFAAAAAVAVALLLGTSVSTWQAFRARKESARARQAESSANTSLYAANMRLAQYAWEQNRAGQVRRLLEETAAYPSRGFEWYYWQRQSHLQLQTLRGHQAAVLSVAVSPDDRFIATGSQDGAAKIWESGSGKLLRTLEAHEGAISSVAFSPDGQRIVTGSWDHTALVWEWAGGKLLQQLKGSHKTRISRVSFEAILSVAFSPDGRNVISCGQDNTARIWDASTGAEKFVLRHSHWVWSAAFSDDGRWIATASHDHTAKVWDAATGELLRTFSEHTAPIHAVAFSPLDQRVATASRDRTVRVWDPVSGREILQPLTGHNGPIQSVAFSQDGQRLVTGSFDQTAKVWDPASGRELFTIRGHGSPISSVAFSADGRRVITGGGSVGIPPGSRYVFPGLGDNMAKVWSASGGKEPLTFRGHSDKVQAVAFSPDGQRVITGSWDKTAIVWDAASGKSLLQLTGHVDVVRTVAFSPNGQRVATGSRDNTARIWDANTGKELLLVAHSDNFVFSMAFSPDGQRIVTGGGDGTLRVWSAVDGKLLASLDGHDWIWSVAFSPNGQWIATAREDRTTAIWEAATGRRLHILAGHDQPLKGVAFSPDSQRVITGSEDATARIWDVATGKHRLRLLNTIEIYSVAFSPDGQRVVTGGKDGTAKIWDAFNGRELLTLTGHIDVIISVAFSADGQRIVTGSWDHTARVWQAATEEEVLRWRAEEEPAQDQQAASSRRAIAK